MKATSFFTLSLLLCAVSHAVDVPTEPIAKKGAVVLSDDFNRTELGAGWSTFVPTFTVAEGVLKGTQTKEEHGAVCGVKALIKDGIVEAKFRFEGATSLNFGWDDREFKGSHSGHICRVTVTPKQISLSDDKEGSMRTDIYEMRKDPAHKAEGDKLLKGRSVSIPTPFELNRWYKLTIEVADDAMRVSLDDKPVGYLKSPGIAHPTKSLLHIGQTGKEAASFSSLRIWAAAK